MDHSQAKGLFGRTLLYGYESVSHDLLISSRMRFKISELWPVLGYSWENLSELRIREANQLANYVTLV